MDKSGIRWLFFGLMVAWQLYIPASLVWQHASTVDQGTVFKFRTAPVDPNDPFRGRYVALQFADNRLEVDQGSMWSQGQTVFAVIGEDENGYARVEDISEVPPVSTDVYVETTIGQVITGNRDAVVLDFPFNRLYMEESMALAAEQVYRESFQDSALVTYALVHIHSGEAVLSDVEINGVSIKELARNQ